ncbi:MAG: hypothetical protein KME38_04335 [Spirirestis rafaelensis WJT71-NPBG6]|jgi:hypothetical protein|nr:hypothetical protein [Spirirestis rafaelensis WJT71-NPBG6]
MSENKNFYSLNESEIQVAGTVSSEIYQQLLRLLDKLDVKNLSEEELATIADKFQEKLAESVSPSRLAQMMRGNQTIMGNKDMFAIKEETFYGMVGDIVDVLSKHLGPEPANSVVKELIKAVISKL